MRKKTLAIVLGLGGISLCIICAVWLVKPPSPLEKEVWPNWSPDGQYLAYECYLEGPTAGVFESNQRYFTDDAADICVISSDGRNRVRLGSAIK